MLRIVMMAAVLARAAEAAAVGEAAPAPPLEDSAEAPAAEQGERFDDPNHTRLMFAPTGRPMAKGQAYFSDHELVFPGFGYAFTDNVSLSGGVSTIPGLGLDEQVAYVSPKIGFQLSDRAAVAVGGLIAGMPAWDDDIGTLGAAYAVGTFGSRDHSLSVGVGVVRELGDRWADTEPIVMIGGQTRLSRSIALVSENWLVLDGEVGWNEQPFGLAVRFFNDRISADVGVVLIGDALDEGYPIPWVSLTYSFGGPARPRPTARAGRSRRP